MAAILAGERFGRLTVVEYVGSRRSAGAMRRHFRCACDCGEEVEVASKYLSNGHTQSCGCLQREYQHVHFGRRNAERERSHGHTVGQMRSSTYRTWEAMKRRCTQPACSDWSYYGGRGITLCEAWMDFENFLADMGERPSGRTLDRVEPDGNYEPRNCRWATPSEQRANRSRYAKVA